MSDEINVLVKKHLDEAAFQCSSMLNKMIYEPSQFKFRRLTLDERVRRLERQYSPKHDRFDSWKEDIRAEVDCDC